MSIYTPNKHAAYLVWVAPDFAVAGCLLSSLKAGNSNVLPAHIVSAHIDF